MTHQTFKAGDTLSEIAKAKKTTVGELMRANPGQIGNRDLIYPGQKLHIPKRGVVQPERSKPAPPTTTKPKQNTPPKVVSVPARSQVNTPTNTTRADFSYLKHKSRIEQ